MVGSFRERWKVKITSFGWYRIGPWLSYTTPQFTRPIPASTSVGDIQQNGAETDRPGGRYVSGQVEETTVAQ